MKFRLRAEQILSSSSGKIPLLPLLNFNRITRRKSPATPYRTQSTLGSKAQNI